MVLSQEQDPTCWRCMIINFSVSLINRMNSALNLAKENLLRRSINLIAASSRGLSVLIWEQSGCNAQFILVTFDLQIAMEIRIFYRGCERFPHVI